MISLIWNGLTKPINETSPDEFLMGATVGYLIFHISAYFIASYMAKRIK